MEKQINLRLLDLLTTGMSTEQVEQIRIHVSTAPMLDRPSKQRSQRAFA